MPIISSDRPAPEGPRPPAPTPTKRGGKRAGAGRKPLGEERLTEVTIGLPADLLARLDAYAAEHDLTRREAARLLLKKILPSL